MTDFNDSLSDITPDDSRKAFEEWAEHEEDCNLARTVGREHYLDSWTQAAWTGWQSAWDARESEGGCQHPYVKIGKYIVAAYPEYIWIGLDGDGEGGGFDEAKLEAVIDKFYEENF